LRFDEFSGDLIRGFSVRIGFVGFRNFPPFNDGIIEFPPSPEKGQGEVHLITGQNGTGKTRLLCALTAACGNPKDLESRFPVDSDSELYIGFQAGFRHVLFVRSIAALYAFNSVEHFHKNVAILKSSNLRSVSGADAAYATLSQFAQSESVDYSAQAYRGSARISDQKITAMQSVKSIDPILSLSFERESAEDSMICQSMANLKMGAAMEYQSGAPRDECRSVKITERFELAIGAVTGKAFSFQVRAQPTVHLVARWGKDVLLLSQLPDGLRSIIAWLVACIAKLDAQFPLHANPLDTPMILLIDEPETHLHPAWQRKLIPAAQKLFPNAQMFVVTHSPFVISSVNVGWIHVLQMDADGLVSAGEPIECTKGDSYIDVVEDVLGVSEIYDPETEAMLGEFRSMKASVTPLGTTSISELEAKAIEIGARSESLQGIMAREIHQLRRNIQEGALIHEDA
jgi:energy-coupling factor transporter ATP-binding protein EcfA2